MTTQRNPRRLVLAQLRDIRKLLDWTNKRWNVSGKVWVAGYGGDRKREPHEYPENDVQEWARLMKVAEQLRLAAEEMELQAAEQVLALTKAAAVAR